MAEPAVPYIVIDGIKFSPKFSEEKVKSSLQYKPKDGDLFIATFPRSGTNWTHQLVYLIHHKGEPAKSPVQFHKSAVYIELQGAEAVEEMEPPAVIITHLPFERTPFSPSAKYINIVRNPKDCFTSVYHFFDSIKFNMSKQHLDVNRFFDDFITGNIACDSYFDHVMSWYHHRNDPNVLFLTYEEMKKDIKAAVLKMATFMGEEYKEAVSDDAIMSKIVANSNVKSVGQMFDVSSIKPSDGDLPEEYKQALSNTRFIRKGVVGDWKNLISEDQAAKLDEIFQEKMKGTELIEIWKEY